MKPDLYRDCPSPHPQRECPRCRTLEDVRCYRKGGVKALSRCPSCGSMLADESLWVETRAWCEKEWRLLEQAIKAGCPSFEGLRDVRQVVEWSLTVVVQVAVTFDPTRGVKFGTVVYGMLRRAAKRFPRRMRTVDPERLNRRAG